MLTVTPAAVRWIAQLLDDVTGRRDTEDVLRLSCLGDDQLRFTLAEVRRDDFTYRSEQRVVLVVDPALAERFVDVTIERDQSERGAGVIATRATKTHE